MLAGQLGFYGTLGVDLKSTSPHSLCSSFQSAQVTTCRDPWRGFGCHVPWHSTSSGRGTSGPFLWHLAASSLHVPAVSAGSSFPMLPTTLSVQCPFWKVRSSSEATRAIQKIFLAGNHISTVAGQLGVSGRSGDGGHVGILWARGPCFWRGPALMATLLEPAGLALSQTHLFVSDQGPSNVKKREHPSLEGFVHRQPCGASGGLDLRAAWCC